MRSGSPGSRMPIGRSPGTTPSGEISTSVLKLSSSSAIAARGTLLLLLVELEAEEIGGAEGEEALGLVGDGQLVELALLAPLDALELDQRVGQAVGRDLAVAHRDQELALAGVAETLGERLALGLVEGRPFPLEQEREDVLAHRIGALLLALTDGAADGGAGLAGRGDGDPVRGRPMVLVADDLDLVARVQLGDERHDPAVDLGADAGVADVGVERVGEVDRASRRAAGRSAGRGG